MWSRTSHPDLQTLGYLERRWYHYTKAGDIITFNWDQNSQPNNGFADHIGIAESVSNGTIHTIEGNSNNQVRRNTYRIGHGNIRGFATLKLLTKRSPVASFFSLSTLLRKTIRRGLDLMVSG